MRLHRYLRQCRTPRVRAPRRERRRARGGFCVAHRRKHGPETTSSRKNNRLTQPGRRLGFGLVTGTTCGDNRGQWARPRHAAPNRPSNPKETAGSRGIHVPPYKSSGKTKLCARARRCANGGARGGNSALPIVENMRQKQRHLGTPIGWRSPVALGVWFGYWGNLATFYRWRRRTPRARRRARAWGVLYCPQ